MKQSWWDNYAVYLKSVEWDILRSACLARDGECCTECGSTVVLQAHHIKYPKNIWDTKLAHLQTLCLVCHKKKHPNGPRGKQRALSWADHLDKIESAEFPLTEDQVRTLHDIKKLTAHRDHTLRHRANVLLKSSKGAVCTNQTNQTTKNGVLIYD
jgi:hypothetical protein